MVTNWKEIGAAEPKYSIVGDKHRGDGSYENPYRVGSIDIWGNYSLGAGSFGNLIIAALNDGSILSGEGVNHTKINDLIIHKSNPRITHITVSKLIRRTNSACEVQFCQILKGLEYTNGDGSFNIQNSIFRIELPLAFKNTHSNVFYKATINTADASFRSTNSLFANCTINLTQKNITDFSNAYIGFDNCTFKVNGATHKWGMTQEQIDAGLTKEQAYRAGFVEFLEKQGITVPEVTSTTQGKGKMTKWLFDDESMVGYRVIEDSMLDRFMNGNNIALGGVGVHGKVTQAIRVTTDKGKKASINSNTVTNKLTVGAGEVLLNDDFNIAFHKDQYITSNIISLNGRKRITELDFMSNLPINNGYVAGSFKGTEKEVLSTETLQAGRHYLVRVKEAAVNGGEGIVVYDGKEYSSASGLKTNAFYVKDANIKITSATNAKIYLLRGSEMYQPIEMRIVDAISKTKVTAGTALVDGMWYFVNSDTSNKDASVTYGGVKYELGSSFVARGTGSFTATLDGHLLACYKDDYTFDPSKKEQQPIWFDIDPTNLKCIMSADPQYASSMKVDASNGTYTYYGSGHPDFYRLVHSNDGTGSFPHDIQGQFFQVRIKISPQDIVG